MSAETRAAKRRARVASLSARISEGLRYGRLFLRIIWQSNRALLCITVGLHAAKSGLPVGMLWIAKLIIDAVVLVRMRHAGNPMSVWKLLALEIVLAVSNDLLGRAAAVADSHLTDKVGHELNIRLMRHAAQLDLTSFENPGFHDCLERARRQSTGRLSLISTGLNCFQDLASLVLLSSAIVLFTPWLLVLLVISGIPAFLGETRFTFLQYSVLYNRSPERRHLDYLRFLGASSQAAKEVKIYGLIEFLIDRYSRMSAAITDQNLRLARGHAGTAALLNIISSAGYYGAYAVVVAKALGGTLSIGAFTFIARSFYRSHANIERIFSYISDLGEELLLLKDLFVFFELQGNIRSKANPASVPRPIKDGFLFRDVSFAYPGVNTQALTNLNFRIHAGERIALIGENGAGKTTIAKLLARLYDPTAGEILLDGIDLREYDVSELRSRIGVIFQDYMRYETTARENIAFGDISAMEDLSRQRAAALQSGAAALISRLPRQYEQMLGKMFAGGVELSGGEWQKIALTRAYLRDSEILILDEPSASLDARAESQVFQRVLGTLSHKMAVLISHRFSTVRLADRILVLHGGLLMEDGTHNELLRAGGLYSDLFELQAASYR